MTMGTSLAAARASTYMLTLASLSLSVHEPAAYNLLEPLEALETPDRSGLTLKQRCDWDSVLATMRATPFENGMDHPAERSLTDFIERFGGEAFIALTQEWQNDAPGQFATLLRLAGRLAGIDHYTRRTLVTRGLSSSDSDIRDAAIQCVEVSQATELISDLLAHDEPDPFIREYRDGVIDDLTG